LDSSTVPTKVSVGGKFVGISVPDTRGVLVKIIRAVVVWVGIAGTVSVTADVGVGAAEVATEHETCRSVLSAIKEIKLKSERFMCGLCIKYLRLFVLHPTRCGAVVASMDSMRQIPYRIDILLNID
jgi:hypothetical protein